jgi:hypothetical protein
MKGGPLNLHSLGGRCKQRIARSASANKLRKAGNALDTAGLCWATANALHPEKRTTEDARAFLARASMEHSVNDILNVDGINQLLATIRQMYDFGVDRNFVVNAKRDNGRWVATAEGLEGVAGVGASAEDATHELETMFKRTVQFVNFGLVETAEESDIERLRDTVDTLAGQVLGATPQERAARLLQLARDTNLSIDLPH